MIGNNKKGFTLIETVIVLGIFSIATTYAISIFIQSNTVQKRTANIQRSTSDARYVLEVMAREFRMGTVDYDYYDGGSIPVPVDTLALRDENNSPVIFKKMNSSGREAIQVCYEFNEETKKRELEGIISALKEFDLKSGIVLTYNQEDRFLIQNKEIIVLPVWKWLLEK